jgi:hypothetical protein
VSDAGYIRQRNGKPSATQLEIHRVGHCVDDGSGWHLAVSIKGSFAIDRLTDLTTHDRNSGETSQDDGGKSAKASAGLQLRLKNYV